MNCRNCNTELAEEANYCPECGARVVKERITLRYLFKDVLENVVGWDSKYILTFRMLFTHPGTVLREYLQGTRKKFVNPFVIFTVMAAASLITFNQFSDSYLSMTGEISNNQSFLMFDAVDSSDFHTQGLDSLAVEQLVEQRESQLEAAQKQQELNTLVQSTILKFFNLFAFVMLPFYSFIAFLVYGRKRNNFAEHLVINAYLQSATFLVSIVSFIFSIITGFNIFSFGLLLTISYYTYAYARLYEMSFGAALLRLLKFIGVLILVMIGIIIVGIAIAIIPKIMTGGLH